MNQTFYGVDIILHPEGIRGKELHDQGKVIEINGLHSGASFYRTGDYRFYEKIMKEFSEKAGGKKILLNYDPEWEFKKEESPGMKQAKEESHRDTLARTKQWQEQLTTNPQTNFYSIHDYLVEKANWEKDSQDDFKTRQTALYLKAAREAGVAVDSFINIKVFGGLLKYGKKELDNSFPSQFSRSRLDQDKPIAELPYGVVPKTTFKQDYLPVEDIGLAWCQYSKGDEFLIGQDRLLNSYFEEAVLNDKALFYLYSQFLPKEKRTLDKFIPKTFFYGLGMQTQDGFKDFIKACDSDIFVKKPLFEAHGIGVEFLTRNQMYKYDRSPFHDNSPSAIREGYRKLVMDLVLGDLNVNQETVVLQENIESARILDQESGNKYTACARAIVQNGKYVGAIWRSNKKDDENINLTERLRHNVTNGAQVMPVSPEDSRLLGEIAEAAVQGFHDTNEGIVEALGEKSVPFFDIYEGRYDLDKDVNILQNAFYFGNIKRSASHHGVDISDVLDRWVAEKGIGVRLESSAFFDKIKKFNDNL